MGEKKIKPELLFRLEADMLLTNLCSFLIKKNQMEVYFEVAFSSYGTEVFSATQYRLPLFSWFELFIIINSRRADFSLKRSVYSHILSM
jgi:hypothetical protein